MNLTVERTDAELQFLMAHDSDLFNRWQAAQDYARAGAAASDASRSAGGGRPAQPRPSSMRWRSTLGDESLEPGYRAQLL